MSNQQILERAVKKAIDNGCGRNEKWTWLKTENPVQTALSNIQHPNILLFDKTFAKALFGEKGVHNSLNPAYLQKNNKGEVIGILQEHSPAWAFHLQQMVIAEDPIKYLGEHLDEDS